MITVLAAMACAPSRPSRTTSPSAPLPSAQGLLVTDSLLPEEIAEITVIKGNSMGDRLGKSRRRQLMDTLVLQQHRWEQMRPLLYRIRVVEQSHCMVIDTRKGPQRWPRVIVRDTVVVGTEEELRPAEYRNRCLLVWRVEDLFRDLARALADTTEYVHQGIVYDTVYGFPRSFWTSAGYGRGWGRLVESFVPAP